MKTVDALDGLTRTLRCNEFVDNVDALDHQHVVLELDLSARQASKPLHRDLARFQRASEGAGKSAPRRGDDIVERRCVRLDLCRIDLVMLGNRAMNAESYRLFLRRQIRKAIGPAEPLDANGRDVNNVAHGPMFSFVHN